MYIIYNNILYVLINYRGKYKITTYFRDKCDSTFEKTWDYYSKECLELDNHIQAIFEVDFVLTYIDTSETTKHGTYETRWNVNEGKAMHKSPVIEKDEVGLTIPHDSWSEDWIQDDKYSCCKIVNYMIAVNTQLYLPMYLKMGKNWRNLWWKKNRLWQRSLKKK